ncbi:MAG: PilC/PilY family type IV pilus protein [Pseudomonadota bacterium]
MQSKPTPSITRRFSAAALCVALALTPPKFAGAEDIDLFLNAAATDSTRPNVLIFLDNSANWNSNAQHWPTPAGQSGVFKQGQSELRAIRTILDELNVNAATPSVNLGLMMFRAGSPDGAIVRFGIRTMNTVNIAAFKELIGPDSGCVAGNNSLASNGTPNCILQNFSGGSDIEMVNSASTSYSAGLFDAYKYFGGFTSPAYAQADTQPPSALNDSTHYGKQRYFGGASVSRMDAAAYTTVVTDKDTYVSPIDSPCAKNYIVFIGNGFPSQDTGGTLIRNVSTGNPVVTPTPLPNQLAMQNFTTITGPVVTNLGTDAACKSTAQCATDAAAVHGTDYDTYSCTGGSTVATPTPLGVDGFCETNAACISRASGTSGFTSYSCSGGNTVTPTATNLGTDSVCETNAACVTRATAGFPGHTSYSCIGGTNPSAVNLGTDAACKTPANCVSDAATANGTLYSSYSCSGGTGTGCTGQRLKNQTILGTCSGPSLKNQSMQGLAGTACNSPNLINQSMAGSNSCIQNMTIQGTKAVTTVTPLSTFTTPSGGTVNYADEWAQLLYSTDVTSLAGQQNAAVYTIDVFKDAQDANETALLFNMARYGGGKYFQASSEDAIVNALRQILIEIQSVNSVFASASLPINATNRSQNENQVFIGMFRPDGAGSPRWYGNLKRYQIAKFGEEFKLADASTPPLDAVSPTTGFVQPCAMSFYTQDSGAYWSFQTGSAGKCGTALLAGRSQFSDAPDGPQVEKGAVAEVLRRGNSPPTTAGVQSPPPGVNRTLYTCVNSTNCCATPATCSASPTNEMVSFDSINVSKTQLGNAAMSDLVRDQIINYTKGLDISDANQNIFSPLLPSPPGFDGVSDVRPTVHGDVAHSRPLPVNYGSTPHAVNASGTKGVVLFYGANDGTFRAVKGSDTSAAVKDGGKELWAFLAPEHHSRLKRLTDNSPPILYTGQVSPPVGATAKDYFFDGSAGLFQNSNNSKVWVFPTMRRGGRMVYAFDVGDPAAPTMKWRLGCTNSDLSNTASCTTGFEQMGQSWSIPSVMLVAGYGTDVNDPLIIMGGGYDSCDDQDAVPNTACGSRKGNAVYVINANTGALVKSFATEGSVPSDVTLVDRDFDGFADHAYVSDTLGNFYRIDFVNPANVSSTRAAAHWRINKIGYTNGDNIPPTAANRKRKFLFAPAVLPSGGKLYVTNASGDRERPLISNYPSTVAKGGPVINRAYMLVDDLSVKTDIVSGVDVVSAALPVDMDDSSATGFMQNRTTTDTGCGQGSPEAASKRGWFFNLNNGTGEQGVTSSLIFGGLVFFSTNRPIATAPGACANDLGEARGYAVNLLTASGAVSTDNLCGGNRSGIFIGGGLPPSPVTGVVPVGGVPVTVMIGGIQRTGGASSPIGSQRVRPIISQKRSRIYWYRDGDK